MDPESTVQSSVPDVTLDSQSPVVFTQADMNNLNHLSCLVSSHSASLASIQSNVRDLTQMLQQFISSQPLPASCPSQPDPHPVQATPVQVVSQDFYNSKQIPPQL